MGIFSNSTCPVPAGADDFDHHGSAHMPMVYVGGAATVVTLVICVSLIVQHLRRYRCPKEQRQIVRMAFSPFVFALVAFFEIYSYRIAPYIDPLGDLYESFGLCALFLLYMQYAAPGGTFDQETFDAVQQAEEGERTNFDWIRITWIFVFQYPIMEVISIVILEVTEAIGVYCVQSLSPRFGHLYYTILTSVSVGACVLAILRFYGRMKNRIKARRGLAKLVCFKLIVFLRFAQGLVFSILLQHNVIKPSNTFGYNDIIYGLESTVTCVEMALLSLGFWYAYSSTEYSSNAKPSEHPVPLHKAMLDAINPWDILAGIGRVFGIVLHLQQTGGFDEWRAHKKQAKVDKNTGRVSGRRNQGRYQTVDGMESLAHPGASHGKSSSQFEETSYRPVDGQQMYEPPSVSPPSYEDRYLMTDSRHSRASSVPNARPVWDGQRYDRSPSPGTYTGEGTRQRDLV